ncbi:YqcI/YcgG family protein [Bradyrhizobium sp. ISRA443]|uniref:YqcI/YcgG family protein n=1 Tax=unclassified Bradyrhizobium TaxID=2631580 RepID=UPI002478C4E4|nr:MULTISPECIES: YqcI/YcgG family protein [unclassified Bradyrhizobium]WGR93322.1 YqcI/YcgG family protein [Bradyrhizobium sp. ISRA435]WGR97854.1 YqcI/YcgG family protein [Bradyrhizobium sp. ISRA436]WGS04744.1 YqcI/YcgG family protein [Bradyrhizobium sp. ISRA437]WGS11625.1 YqcI/YcgG family protein [Bradyrhizobium sp. ISRA443]
MLINQGELANLTDKFQWGHAAISYVLSKFNNVAENGPGFPCFFGRSAVKRGKLRFLLIPYDYGKSRYELDILACGLRTYIEQIDIDALDVKGHHPLLVLFEPVAALSTTDHFKQVFIEAMQFLIDEDRRPWPVHVAKDPAHHTWTMCFHGCELFVNVSHPAYVLRRSRNMGAGLAFVINPRKIFDIAAPADQRGRAITAKIRRSIDIYDDVTHSPLLGSYVLGEAQWPQYMIPDNNEDAPLECPLHFK